MLLSEVRLFFPNWALFFFFSASASVLNWSQWGEIVLAVRNPKQRNDIHWSKAATRVLFLILNFFFFCVASPLFLFTEQMFHSFSTTQAFNLNPAYIFTLTLWRIARRVKRSHTKFLKGEYWPKVRAATISLKGPVPILFWDRMLNW